MLKKYIVRAGFTFLGANNAVVTGGEQIDLPDDVANEHLHKLELVEPPEAGQETKSGKSNAAKKASAAAIAPVATFVGNLEAVIGGADTSAGADPAAVSDSAAAQQ